jgi:hypothetical protein
LRSKWIFAYFLSRFLKTLRLLRLNWKSLDFKNLKQKS